MRSKPCGNGLRDQMSYVPWHYSGYRPFLSILSAIYVFRRIDVQYIAAITPACDPSVEVCETGTIGKIAIKQYEREAGAERIKLKITHPMETGFVTDVKGEIIPEYFVKNIHVDDNQGPIADITTFAALSSDPVILLDLPKKGQSVKIQAIDSLGLEFFSFKNNNTM